MRMIRIKHKPALRLILVCLLLLACAAASCGQDVPPEPSNDPSAAVSDIPSGSESAAASDEPVPEPVSEPGQGETGLLTFDLERFLPDEQSDAATATEEELKAVCPSLSLEKSSFPCLLPPYMTQSGDCRTVLVLSAERGNESDPYVAKIAVFRFDTESKDWKPVSGFGTPVVYDRNRLNADGCFSIEFGEGAKTGKPSPYAVLYQEACAGEPRVLLFNDRKEEYPRILRQNDDYAVLSLLKGDDRVYRVISNTGEELYRFDGDVQIAERAPLTFFEGSLLCKTDTDDDYEYDTLQILNLTTGEIRTAASFGNCSHWTYARSGEWVAAYDEDAGPVTMHLFHVRTETELSFVCPSAPGENLISEGGVLLTDGKEGADYAYAVWSADGRVLETVPKTESDGSGIAVSEHMFAFGGPKAVSVYVTNPLAD